ncbi:MAG: serine/threonine-protein kinase, partial [Acidobacteriota bacterium]
MSRAPSSIPRQLGRYRVLRRLAAGGMGEVLLGHDDGLDRPVAIKRLRPGSRVGPERRARFRREARLAARLHHPNIVRVYDLLEHGGHDCIVMEFVECTTLRRLLRDGPLDERLVLELALEIARGLAAAHEAGIVHRDLKTENVLVTEDGHPKISDFGVAKRFLADDESDLTAQNGLIGTCRVMAPEQALGEPVDHRADLFSFGVLLYEAAVGVSPFESRTDLVTLKRLTSDPHVPARDLRPEISPGLSRLIDRLLAKKASQRLQTTEELITRLEGLIDGDDSMTSGLLRLIGPLQEWLRGSRRRDSVVSSADNQTAPVRMPPLAEETRTPAP